MTTQLDPRLRDKMPFLDDRPYFATPATMGPTAAGEQNHRLLVSVTGPAGVGKSAVVAALRKRLPGWSVAPKIGDERGRLLPELLLHTLWLAPDLARLQITHQRVEILASKWMVYSATLKSWVNRQQVPVVMDEGGVYLLVRLFLELDGRGFGGARQWWNNTLEEWARSLDLIVLLDAPDAVLTDRIRTRSQAHCMKHRTTPEVMAFLERYRRAFAHVVGELEQRGTIRVLHRNTAQLDAGEIVDEIIAISDARKRQ